MPATYIEELLFSKRGKCQARKVAFMSFQQPDMDATQTPLYRSEQASRCSQEARTSPRELQHSSPTSTLHWFPDGVPEVVHPVSYSPQGIGDNGNENKRELIFSLV